MARKDRGDYEGARRSLEQAVALDPDHAGAHRWLSLMLSHGRSYAAAAAHLERALALDAGIVDGWIELGMIHYQQHDLLKAALCLRRAIEAVPDSVAAHTNLGVVLREAGRPREALVHTRRAHELAPHEKEVVRNLVLTLVEVELCEEALAVASRAVELNPESYEANLALGFAHYSLHDPSRALEYYDLAERLQSGEAELYYNRGLAQQDLGRLPQAFEDYERAIARQPEFPLALLHRALARLLTGDFQRGWDDYEARRLNPRDFPRRAGGLPQWDGSPLAGRKLLVYREQGLGDEIMFGSILPQAISAAGHCFVECDPKLLALFRRSFPAATVFAATTDRGLPPGVAASGIDAEVAAGTLPRFFRRELRDFPRHGGYLKADTQAIDRWRGRLAEMGPGFKVGVSWTGGTLRTRRPLRSIPLDRWLPILEIPGVRFVSLQYTAEAARELAALKDSHGVHIAHWREAIDDYDETAALVSALDLVVSVCTSAIHLGGALGRPVWAMAPYVPEWRYGFSGEDMPWYPSVKIFRQSASREWGPVISSAATQLKRLAGGAG